MPRRISAFLNAWIDNLAGAIAATGDRLAGRDRPLRASPEGSDWIFLDADDQPAGRIVAEAETDQALNGLLRGRHVDIILPESQWFRAELPPVPGESREFLPAIVEHRVDRIAPWRRPDRLTGFRARSDDKGQIAVNIAVTARLFVAPIIAAAEAAGARSLSIDASGGSGSDVEIEIELSSSNLRRGRIRRLARSAVLLFATLAVGWAGLLGWYDYDLAARSAELQERVDQRMAILRKAAAAAEQGATGSVDPVDHAKQTGPVTVVVLEALSRLLPDDTWLSTLRFEGKTVRIAGVTRSVSRLVPLLVASPYFSDAAFVDPTERQQDGSDRFSIELTIRPSSRMEAL